MNNTNQPEICSLYEFVRKATDVAGTTFFPILTNHSNDEDVSAAGAPTPPPPYDNSDLEIRLVKTISSKFKKTPINMMEIGVNRSGPRAFTKMLLENKHPDSKYLGVDIEDKSGLNDSSNNIMTYQINSQSQDEIRTKLYHLGMLNLSILLIDGWHSVNMAFNDWRYADLVVKGGYVIIHDVHWHPGPRMLIEAIDRKQYDVKVPTKFTPNQYGMGIVRKL